MTAIDPLRGVLQDWLKITREQERTEWLPNRAIDGSVMKRSYFTTDEIAALLAGHPAPVTHTEYCIQNPVNPDELMSEPVEGRAAQKFIADMRAVGMGDALVTRQVTAWEPVKEEA